MRCFSWNCSALVNPWAVRHLRDVRYREVSWDLLSGLAHLSFLPWLVMRLYGLLRSLRVDCRIGTWKCFDKMIFCCGLSNLGLLGTWLPWGVSGDQNLYSFFG